ncbi:unnamed protein product [Paramecium octaurelia]|uniref:Uncharacterized protein n=1 Tax=Paramecium octaurelia TaxID=43137 RepID=A0A8S1Y3K9_PAROT|nr:unnamed protein product [Paramecium octaurelia]CAD8208579.1 unnamed protein product [Paramecium octaurelia]
MLTINRQIIYKLPDFILNLNIDLSSPQTQIPTSFSQERSCFRCFDAIKNAKITLVENAQKTLIIQIEKEDFNFKCKQQNNIYQSQANERNILKFLLNKKEFRRKSKLLIYYRILIKKRVIRRRKIKTR